MTENGEVQDIAFLKARNPGNSLSNIKAIEKMLIEEDFKEVTTEELVDKEPLDNSYAIYGVRIGGIELVVDNKNTYTFEEVAKRIHTELIDDEAEKILIMKKDDSDELKEVVCTREAGFHATAMIIKYFKDRQKALKEFDRLKEHRINQMVCMAKKVIRRRNNKKLNKKFKK